MTPADFTHADKERLTALFAIGDGCWEWQGYRNPQGYGVFHFQGKSRRAHRVSYALYVGEIPAGRMVCHRCDNPACIRPDHLFLGTGKDNAADCIAKGRFPFRNQPMGKTCRRGHELSPDNTYRRKSGKRECRICKQAAELARRTNHATPRPCRNPPCGTVMTNSGLNTESRNDRPALPA